MTTLVGIVADKGPKGVILGSDLSRTQTKWTPQGDVAYRQQTKLEGQKIYVGDQKDFALCMSGVFDQLYTDFLADVLGGNINVKKAVSSGYFKEFAMLNDKRWGGRVPDTEYMNALLLATRFDNNPKLYTCFPLGRIEPRAWTSIGSGSDYALKHISEKGKLIPKRVTLKEGIDLTVESLEKASQDIYTGGLDLVIVTPKNIISFGDQIKQNIDVAKQRIINQIKKKLN